MSTFIRPPAFAQLDASSEAALIKQVKEACNKEPSKTMAFDEGLLKEALARVGVTQMPREWLYELCPNRECRKIVSQRMYVLLPTGGQQA